jgi:hypothetical protein
MTMDELQLIKSMLINSVCPPEDDCYMCRKAKEAHRIIDREVNLKQLDPRGKKAEGK